MSLEQTLKERGSRYGDFAEGARIMQKVKAAIRNNSNFHKLRPFQQEALEMIAHKIGRILNGDPNYIDNWHDIAGFATLVEKELSK